MSDEPERAKPVSFSRSRPRLWVRLVIALLDFGALLYFLDLKVRAGVPVDAWIFMLLVAILGSMMGLDILKDLQGTGGGPGGN